MSTGKGCCNRASAQGILYRAQGIDSVLRCPENYIRTVARSGDTDLWSGERLSHPSCLGFGNCPTLGIEIQLRGLWVSTAQ